MQSDAPQDGDGDGEDDMGEDGEDGEGPLGMLASMLNIDTALDGRDSAGSLRSPRSPAVSARPLSAVSLHSAASADGEGLGANEWQREFNAAWPERRQSPVLSQGAKLLLEVLMVCMGNVDIILLLVPAAPSAPCARSHHHPAQTTTLSPFEHKGARLRCKVTTCCVCRAAGDGAVRAGGLQPVLPAAELQLTAAAAARARELLDAPNASARLAISAHAAASPHPIT